MSGLGVPGDSFQDLGNFSKPSRSWCDLSLELIVAAHGNAHDSLQLSPLKKVRNSAQIVEQIPGMFQVDLADRDREQI